ncbi:hypothetical protein Zmor_000562 [Zophobas morio]|uniref:Ferritin n=1 Tax=Zophobas morio TaxID=2755281 RepID=A0AA38MRE6_9CUCU|nr:hypothetical protein Zmor_000562 [Zophobas morio]
MKAFVVFAVLFVAVYAADDTCYKKFDGICSGTTAKSPLPVDLSTCTASYGHIDVVLRHLIGFANSHIVRSMEYLLMSTYYGNYQKNRAGFEKLFRDLSDAKWDHAIELIKHVTTRGGSMKFTPPDFLNTEEPNVYEGYEIQSIAKALDKEKQLALEAFKVHNEASRRTDGKHDPEISSYIEEEFVHHQAKNIRKLAGYVTDLKSMLSGPDGSLSLFLFDEYLKGQ